MTARSIPVAKPFLKDEEAKAAGEAILSGWVTQGPRVEAFESAFAAYTTAPYAVATSSCTTAIHLALHVAGIGPGDEVICPSYSFIASANAIYHAGATPVFADVAPYTVNMDLKHAESLVTPKTKALLLVHQLGMPADIDAFAEFCRSRKILLIQDAACAIGSLYKGKPVGSVGGTACFSFHPRKVITTGDGGMITTADEEARNRLRRLRQHGMSINDLDRHRAKGLPREEYNEIGYNYRMTDIQAAVGIVQLSRLDYLVAERRKIAARYDSEFKRYDFLDVPQEPDWARCNIQSYWVTLKKNAPISRDEVIARLAAQGISSRRGVMSIHKEKAWRAHYPDLYLPHSEFMSDQSLILPLYVPMSEDDVGYVISALQSIFRRA